MSLSLTAHWPDFTQGIGRVLAIPFVQLRLRAMSALHAAETPAANEHQFRFDASRLGRAELLAELLAPPPDAALVDRCTVADTPLPSAVESAIARKLASARELILRDLLEKMRGSPVFDKPESITEWLRLHCAGLDHEVFLVIYLDAQHRLIAIEQLFRGTLTETSVYSREVVKAALAHSAATVAFAHNHPGGGLEPSRADQCLTGTLKAALSLIDVRVLDHFIVAGAQHYSFAEHGLI
ncbi:JAB domain-containing protein [Ottowia sp.]|uniref:JAB domain-containing protein n=1 Tax=Ottowia sp. TaxID=1898956 RepID=UPI002603B75C|nr:JAB domain-containing protein [Ottowia sp.]